jgi:hypothetical protein
MKHPGKTRGEALQPVSLQPGKVRPRPKPRHSQAHPGVSPLNPLTHRNTSFQPLPRPLQLIAQAIPKAGPMTFHVVGDTGGVKDAEFQNNVAAQ